MVLGQGVLMPAVLKAREKRAVLAMSSRILLKHALWHALAQPVTLCRARNGGGGAQEKHYMA